MPLRMQGWEWQGLCEVWCGDRRRSGGAQPLTLVEGLAIGRGHRSQECDHLATLSSLALAMDCH